MNIEILKSYLVGTPLEDVARRVRWVIGGPKRRRYPELIDIYLEGDRIDQVLRRLVHDSANCIDIGCHIGSVLNVFVKLAPRGRHMAFEPVPWKAGRLTRKFPGVDVRQIALGETSGEATFSIHEDQSGYSGFRTPKGRSSRTSEITVRCERLDQLVPTDRKIDLIKVDVEGAELMVLRGGRELLHRDRPSIIFESASSALSLYGLSPADLFTYLDKDCDYAVFSARGFLERDQPLGLDEYESAHRYPFKAFNFIAVPR